MLMSYKFFDDGIARNGLTYEEYILEWENVIANFDAENSTEKEKKNNEYKKLNFQRTKRVEKQYNVSTELKKLIQEINEDQLWMIITENWCGDSAQSLPVIAKIANENPKISLRILKRDSYLDIMDLFQTNGTRGIPKLVAFDKEGNELLNWGPRPKLLQDLFDKLKDEGIEKKKIYEELHVWYPKFGIDEIEKEFIMMLRKLLNKAKIENN